MTIGAPSLVNYCAPEFSSTGLSFTLLIIILELQIVTPHNVYTDCAASVPFAIFINVEFLPYLAS